MDNYRAENIAKRLLENNSANLQMGEMKAYHELMLKLLLEDKRARFFDGKFHLRSAEAKIIAILSALKFGARTGEDTWELVLPTAMAWQTEKRYALTCQAAKNGCTVIKAQKSQKAAEEKAQEVSLSAYCNDLTGRRFGRVVAIRPVGRAKNGSVEWLFNCDCGNTVVAVGTNVVSGRTRSCGCLRSALSRERMQKKWEGRANA